MDNGGVRASPQSRGPPPDTGGQRTPPAQGVPAVPLAQGLASRVTRAADRGRAIVRRWARDRPFLGVLLAAVAYTVIFGWICSQRYWAFQTYAWDLGNYNQGMFTALFEHRLFFYTADLPSYNPGSLLAAHFSPFLVLLLPVYALAPGPPVLLFIQAAALGAGALPLWAICRKLALPDRWSLLLIAGYLLSPVLMGIGWYDFHPEAFLPLTVTLAVYCYYYARRWAFVAAWLLALSIIETVALLLLGFAAAALLGLLYRQLRGQSSPRADWERSLVGTVLPILWIGFAVAFNGAVLNAGISTLSTAYSGGYSVLGSNLGFIQVLPYAALHPVRAAAAVQYQWSAKLAYLLILFGGLAFLPFLGPKRLLFPVAIWLALVTLSNGYPWYEFGDQFAAYPYPFLVAGAAFGLQRLRIRWIRPVQAPAKAETVRDRRRPWRRRRNVAPYAAGVAVLLGLGVSLSLVSPLLPSPHWMNPYFRYGYPTVTAHDEMLHEVLGLIPATASVLTVSEIFPEVSNRANAYVVPLSSSFRPNLTFVGALDQDINDSQFVLIDFQVDFFGSSVLARFGDLNGFGILAEADQIVLYERGWTGSPIIWSPLAYHWAGGRLFTTDQSYVDPGNATAEGPALSSRPGTAAGSLLWYGPFVYGLPPGDYAVTYWLDLRATYPGQQLRIDSESNPLVIQEQLQGSLDVQHTYGFAFSTLPKVPINSFTLSAYAPLPTASTTNVTLTFTWAGLSVWSVGGWAEANGTAVHLYSVTLQQLSP